MEATDLMVGDLARVSKESICIEKGTIVRVTAVDSEDEIPGLLKGVTHCVSINDENVSGGVWCAFLDPITITTEVLEKIGFECAGSGFVGYFEELYSNQTVEVSLFNVLIENRSIQLHIEDSTGMTLLHMMECNYIHELQHAMRLCRIGKR